MAAGGGDGDGGGGVGESYWEAEHKR